MNLHAIVAGSIAAVNPRVPLTVRVSTGEEETASGGVENTYATPGGGVADFAGSLMTVSAVSDGKLQRGQIVAGAGLAGFPVIVEQVSGTAGGPGVYRLSAAQATLSAVAFATSFVMMGQVQPLGWKDLQQIDGLNLQGTLRKAYLYGQVEAIVRDDEKGGDLITEPSGKVWLVSNVLEDWTSAGWCAVAVTLQNGE